MAKPKGQQDTPRRQSRKEFILTRQQQEQYQKIRLAVIAVVALMAIILIAGAVFEYVIKPGQPVATVNGEDIALQDWQRRVNYERREGIENIESFYEAVGGNVQQLQQFAGQQLTALIYPSVQGEQTLTTMINETLIEQEAAERGITVSDAEVETRIEERFSFFGGAAPTATPAPTETPVPTPSITPIGATAEDVAEEPVVTAEPQPDVVPTAVSQEAFDTALSEALDDFSSSGATEADYRDSVRAELLREKLQDAFAAESDLVTEEENVDFFMMQFSDEAEANAIAAQIDSGEVDYLTAWNTVRSAEFVTATQGTANDYQWTPVSIISSSLGAEIANVMSTIELNTPSDVLTDENGSYFIVQIRDRALQPVSDNVVSSEASALLFDWLEDKRLDVVIYDRWAENVPSRPVLDPKFYVVQPTPVLEVEDVATEAP